MTVRNLDALFQPRCVALVGASPEPGSVGEKIVRNLLEGGFGGKILLVNPRHREILGQPCYKTIDELPFVPDLAVVATPAQTVPDVVSQLGAKGVRAAVVVSAGLGGRLAALPVLTTPPSPMTMMGMTTPTTTPTSSATAADTSAGPKWNLFLGYKLCRVVVGLNLDLLVYSPVGSSNTVTSFLLAPEVQVALARSRDSRAELLGMLSVGLGQAAGFFQLGGTVAPGVRYWVHRHIALSTLLGLQAGITLQGKAGQTVLLSLLGTAGVLGAF